MGFLESHLKKSFFLMNQPIIQFLFFSFVDNHKNHGY